MASNINRKAFLDTIAFSEGTSSHPRTINDGYDVIVTGIEAPRLEVFTDYSRHPFAPWGSRAPARPGKLINGAGLRSTASGRYQILVRFWLDTASRKGYPNFAPMWQDAYALNQIGERAALDNLDGGDFDGVVYAINGIWASFPGRKYTGQSQKTLDTLRAYYVKRGGLFTIDPEATL